MPRAVNRRNG